MKFWGVRLLSFVLAFGFVYGLDVVTQTAFPNLYRLAVLAGLYVTLAVSLNLINGITGQFSIGHAAFYMIGAYAAGFVSQHMYASQPLGPVLWLVVMMAVGAVFAAIAGIVVGLPSLRLRGDYLAIVTLGFGEIMRIVVQNVDPLGGAYGLNVKPFGEPPKILWLVWLLAVLCIAVCRNLLKTSHGLPFIAVREDEVASAAMGVKTSSVKVTAFVIGSAFAGAAGALLAHSETFISPDTFKMDVSFIILTMVVLGGTGSITGSIMAAVALFAIPEWLRTMQVMIPGSSIVAGILAVGIMVSGFRWVQNNYHESVSKRIGAYLACVVGAAVAAVVLSFVLAFIPQLAQQRLDVAMLRMVIFSMVLIILMLLRPQGVFAHHEFSWDWLSKVLRARKGVTA